MAMDAADKKYFDDQFDDIYGALNKLLDKMEEMKPAAAGTTPASAMTKKERFEQRTGKK